MTNQRLNKNLSKIVAGRTLATTTLDKPLAQERKMSCQKPSILWSHHRWAVREVGRGGNILLRKLGHQCYEEKSHKMLWLLNNVWKVLRRRNRWCHKGALLRRLCSQQLLELNFWPLSKPWTHQHQQRRLSQWSNKNSHLHRCPRPDLQNQCRSD